MITLTEQELVAVVGAGIKQGHDEATAYELGTQKGGF